MVPGGGRRQKVEGGSTVKCGGDRIGTCGRGALHVQAAVPGGVGCAGGTDEVV